MKRLPLAAAVLAALTSYTALAEGKPTDILTDGWEVHGYAMMNYRLNQDFESFDSELGKPDYLTAGTSGKNSAQVEMTIKKHTEFNNGVFSDFVVRAEYGNGDSYFYSSSGSEKANNLGQFEIKESYIVLGNLPYLPANSEIWAGRRFLNRASGLITGEFWKQSSGEGAGFETKLASGQRAGFAFVSADPLAGDVITVPDGERNTVTSLDLYFYGVQALGGGWDFDLKFMHQANSNPTPTTNFADDGIGGSITYSRDYYGLDGWSQSAIAYGHGLAANRGVNFGSWSSGWLKDSKALFLTSYGVMNVTPKLQLGTEVTYWAPDNLTWLGGEDGKVSRVIAAVRPSYKVNENLRLEFTGAYASEKLEDGENNNLWGRHSSRTNFYTAEIATVFTVNADYFGRPQIKPYITWVGTDDALAGGSIGITDGKKNQAVFGVQAEIWF